MKKAMILLVNLRPNQFNAIVDEFGDQYDLRLWDGEHSTTSKLASLAKHASRIYSRTDFMRHDTDAVLSKHKERYTRYTGGQSKLRSLLRLECA